MGIRNLKPTTPGSRFASRSDFSEITKNFPEKKLTTALRKTGGRNNKGRITVRHRGGGHRRRYRIIDFKRDKFDIPAKVASIEYDPNRSANIALLFYSDGEKRYILSPFGVKVGDEILSGENVPLKIGNALPLIKVATGMFVHNIELEPGRGGQLARSAGSAAQVMAHDDGFTTLKLPSGEVRQVRQHCFATIGEVGNKSHGVVMNPVDHPHGGGEGKSAGGRHPVSPWGTPTKGYKTRKKNKKSNEYILKRRK